MRLDLSTWLIALLLCSAGMPAGMAQPVQDDSRACREAVQDKIAWNYKGDTHWAENNTKALCAGAEDSTEPARCFESVMHDGIDWGGGTRWNWKNALALCKGTHSAINTVGCFERQMGAGKPWRKAIERCRWDSAVASEEADEPAKPVGRASKESEPATPKVPARRVESDEEQQQPDVSDVMIDSDIARNAMTKQAQDAQESDDDTKEAVDWNEYKEREWGYLKADSGLCLTVNVFDQRKTRKQKIKKKLKKAFDPREHLKAIGVSDKVANALVFGPAGPEMASTVGTLRQIKKLKDAWQGDLKKRLGLTLLQCGSVAPKYQAFRRHQGAFLQVRDGKHFCLSNRKNKNGGRVEIHNCKTKKRRAWYFDGDGTLRNAKGRCLDVHRPQLNDEGARIQMWDCNGQPQQRWNFTAG